MVSFTLHQVTSIVDQANSAPLYRVVNQISAAVGASTCVFVYKTVTQKFEHYATAADMEKWPDNYADAQTQGFMFYRVNSVSRDWQSLQGMTEDLDYTIKRVQSLSNELSRQQGSIVIDRTAVIEGS